MIRSRSIRFSAFAVLLCVSNQLNAQEERPQNARFFESKIRPAFVKHCYECHSNRQGENEGGLTLDSRDGVRRGGDRGPALLPGQPDQSLLIRAITHADPDLAMPPDEKLPSSTIADFKKWIADGALDPRIAEPEKTREVDQTASQNHWAYQKIQPVPPPTSSNSTWPLRPTDAFILSNLEANSIEPSRDASPSVLLRRIYFDLIGLPPTPTERQTFLSQVEQSGIDAALASEVDRLLSLSQFGERWGRHWLDVARYAESSGKESNLTFPHAWRYRDYVIDSFNDDKPYDQFITEQIAGDLLPAASGRQRAEQLIATGFLAIGPKSLNEMNPRQFEADLVDEQIDTLTRSILATSVACARCHDHKSDPFDMEDYYALAGIFYSSDTRFGSSIGPESQITSDFITLPSLPSISIPNRSFVGREYQKLNDRVSELKWEKRLRFMRAITARFTGDQPGKYYSLQDALRIRWSLGGLDAKLKTVDERGRALPLAMGVVESRSPRNVALLRRGELSMPGEIVKRRFPKAIVTNRRFNVPPHQSGRLQLAEWITDPGNPLTSRVIVNRVWQHLFGDGLVSTVDNFGTDGQPPSHPDLLDHLANQFVQESWSVKSLIRELVLSRTYRQCSEYREDAFRQDPENRWLWRANKRRLDAEVIRDAALYVAGRLDQTRPDASLVAKIGNRPVSIIGFDKRVAKDLDGKSYRSVYLPVIRDRLPDAIALFDGAEPSLVTGKRETTNVPLQSLFLMNSSFARQQSESLAERVLRETESTTDRIKLAVDRCYSRIPDEHEMQVALRFLGKDGLESDSERWKEYCQALFCAAEFRNLD